MSRDNVQTEAQRASRSVEQYPFDPSLRPETVQGLDRLRCISDRSYAATLYEIYALAERNEAEAKRRQQRLAQAEERAERARARLRALALRALSGALGPDAQGLARCVAADGDGNLREDDGALQELGRALAELDGL